MAAPNGQLTTICRFCYELRLHRARGYGALKAILDVLAEEEPLTLTEIALRLRRTPGSTKDYLSWLEDVDLIALDRSQPDGCSTRVLLHELLNQMPSAVLLTRDGDGHTSSFLQNSRTSDAIAHYLITGQTPPPNTVYPN